MMTAWTSQRTCARASRWRHARTSCAPTWPRPWPCWPPALTRVRWIWGIVGCVGVVMHIHEFTLCFYGNYVYVRVCCHGDSGLLKHEVVSNCTSCDEQPPVSLLPVFSACPPLLSPCQLCWSSGDTFTPHPFPAYTGGHIDPGHVTSDVSTPSPLQLWQRLLLSCLHFPI